MIDEQINTCATRTGNKYIFQRVLKTKKFIFFGILNLWTYCRNIIENCWGNLTKVKY